MSMTVNTSISAMTAYRNLSVTQGQLDKSMEKLSSGFRINRAADDAAGLVNSEKLRSQVSGNKVAMRNAQDGISVAQTADGALNEVTSMLQRMRDLSVQKANTGSNSTDSNDAIDAETKKLGDELTAMASRTEFNGSKLLDGSYSSKTFQVGANSTDTVTLDLSSVKLTDLKAASASTTIPSIDDLDADLKTITTARGTIGATQNRFEHIIANLGVTVENLSASESRIRDTDVASEMTQLSTTQILGQAGTAMLAQASQSAQNVLTLLRG